MRCPACQHENSEAAKFCEECGRRFSGRCPSCGCDVAPSANFCPECGQRLGRSIPLSDVRASFVSPQAYTPQHLAERMLTFRSALEAEAYYRQALALADELGMRPLAAHCHLGLGTLYTKISRFEQARRELSTAMALYRAMEMTFWLPQAEAALAQVEGRP